MTVLIDEPHEHGDGRSSFAAKKAEAVFRIAFGPAQLPVRPLQLDQPAPVVRRQIRLAAGIDLGLQP
ncbi:MAG: hypothetical protein ACRDWY_05930 [Actinomycetes bacterium]